MLNNRVDAQRAPLSEKSAEAADGTQSTDAAPPDLRERVIMALRTIFDPEIPVNIYDLGLIYAIDITDAGEADIKMTLTAPGCPVAATFPGEVQRKLEAVEGIIKARVQLVWDPPWTKQRMSETALLELGLL